MAVRPVIALPHSVLKARAEELGGPNQQLAADLIDTMRSSPACVGLAAPQIGIAKRAFVVDVTDHPKTKTCHGLVLLFDPVIVERSGSKVGREGCMSVPHMTANVARSTGVVVTGTTLEGEVLVISTDGFEARAFQHELDHLDGMLILDRVDSLSTDVFRRQVYK